MGNCKVVSIEEIKAGNPHLCLSALRYTGNCLKCPAFKTSTGKTCDSAIFDKAELDAIQKMQEEKIALKKRLEEIEKKLGG